MFGYSKQAFYKRRPRQNGHAKAQHAIARVLQIRRQLPRCGVRKLHYLLNEHSNDLLGRDYLFDVLRDAGLLVRRQKKYHKTTNSKHWMRKYPNLVKEMTLVRPEQLWVADITYLRVNKGFSYLHLITDAYSKRIVGYELSDNMHASTTRRALEKALSQRKGTKPLIHHSDRGLQYSSSEYTSLLKANSIAISMTQESDPYENAVAERVNGILKDEFGLDQTFQSQQLLQQHVVQSIALYNQLRPHMSIGMLTPNQAHKQDQITLKTWKTKHPSKHALKGVDIKLKLEI